jgi:putative ABC transport system permease protein
MKRRSVKRLFQFPFRTVDELRQDVDEEFRLHLDLRIEALVASGLSPESARAQALREFGDRRGAAATALAHQVRLERRRGLARGLDELRQDLRHARRSLWRTPGFTMTTVLIVALGIGATTALFSVLSAVLLRPLPYPDAERLVEVWGTRRDNGAARDATALPDYRAMRDGNQSFDALGAFAGTSLILTGGDRAEYVQAVSMTATMWRVLDLPPRLGRTFTEAEQEWGRHRVAVISDGLWKRRFGADAGIVGRQMRVGPQALTIVGVMPPSFQLVGLEADAWLPMAYPPSSVMDTRRNRFASLLGRLKPGVTLEQARQDMSIIAARLAREDPQFNAGRGADLGSWQEGVVGTVRMTLLLLFGAAVLVLLIACANLAHLLIARATIREHELQTRAVLGASRARLIRQVATETSLLVAVGGLAGLGVAFALLRGLTRLGPIGLPRLAEVSMDLPVVAFAGASMLLTTVLSGLWPSWRAGRAGASSRLRAAARTIAGGRLQHRARRAFIVVEVSLSLVLLIGATLLIESLQRLQRVEAGFNDERLLTAMVLRLRPAGRELFMQQLADKVAAIPGVRAAAATTSLPLIPGGWSKYFSVDGRPAPASLGDVPAVRYHHVTPDYFGTMQAAIRRGRPFTTTDSANQPLVAIVNETLARQTWPNEDPIGQRIAMAAPEPLSKHLLPLADGSTMFPRLTVIGVVGDFRHDGLDQPVLPSVFVPLAQAVRAGGGDQIQGFHYFVARAVGEPLALTAAVERAASELDANAAVADVRTMTSRASDSIARRRFATLLLGAFAGLALLLALVGLYGVMSYTVSQRRAELGVRAAVGATAGSLLRLVIADGLRMTFLGAGIGLTLAWGLSDVLATQLYEIQGVNVAVYAGMTAILLIVAAVACYVPAMRAARVDPVTALHSD